MNCTKKDMLLYAVTDRSWTGEKTLMEQVKEALDGGITFLQLREKHLGEEELLREAKDMKALAAAYHVPFIINDNVELALAIDADGVHVGQEDMEAGKVREKLGPDKIIGVSAHSVEEAIEAEKNGADYLGAGAVFSTSTKEDAGALSRETLEAILGGRWCRSGGRRGRRWAPGPEWRPARGRGGGAQGEGDYLFR